MYELFKGMRVRTIYGELATVDDWSPASVEYTTDSGRTSRAHPAKVYTLDGDSLKTRESTIEED